MTRPVYDIPTPSSRPTPAKEAAEAEFDAQLAAAIGRSPLVRAAITRAVDRERIRRGVLGPAERLRITERKDKR